VVSINAWTAQNEPALSGEMLYVWLGLFSAYSFSPRHAAAQLALIAGAYLAVLLASVSGEAVSAAWLTLVGILFPAAALLRAVRDSVTRLVERLSDAALTDTLTGLKNRLALDQELHADVERALREGKPLSLVIGDLDYFKSVNDRLGHRAGDEALVRAGRVLLRHRRAGDSIARTGGEEFTILLPDATEHEAYLVSERMRFAVEREFDGDPAGLTFSFGIATYPNHGRSADAVLEAADQALYSRTVGRYCAMIAEELGLPAEHVKRVEVAGILHDIGKIGLPDAILQKPGPLGKTELAEIRTHPEIGAQILSGRGLEDLREWVLGHHERPDGTGYPRCLADQDIPLEAKILAVADAYEAMVADRVYRPGVDERAARAELLRCAGEQFDARVVAAFLTALGAADAAADSVSGASAA
jgi:two-component system cell cycle response regulator